jgi:hypothetical protein
MKGIAALVFLVLASIASIDALAASAPQTAGPRVVLGVDVRNSHRYVQLSERGGPIYPTADVTCDGNRRTITLTRSESVGGKIVATYAVPPKVSDVMLKAAECRLLIPGREITLGRQQIRAAWATQAKAQKH